MSDWCFPIASALDRRGTPCTVFFRDDDAGWEDRRLFALLDVFARHAVPIDLAVIPSALTPMLANALLQRMSRPGPGGVGVHQHGHAHVNHEREGRKCEFGPSRDYAAQRESIESGHEALIAAFGSLADRIFTPPWNRCTADTAQVLRDLGFDALSRDVTAKPLPGDAIAEIPVAVDWCKHRAAGTGTDVLGARIADALADERCGIMLHHAVMDEADLALLDDLLPLLRGHPMSHCAPMTDLLPGICRAVELPAAAL